MYECDLHTHTCHSDGNDTYCELIDCAAQRGLKVLAITDHDVICASTLTDNNVEISLESYGCMKGVHVLRGIEFSCDTDVEDVHVVALGCRWERDFFKKANEQSIQSKVEGYKELCRCLSQDGMRLDWKRDILLCGQRAQEDVQRKMLFEAMVLKGYATNWKEAKLLVKQNERYKVKREKPDTVYVINEIHQSGGIAILAHPYLITNGDAKTTDSFRKNYIERLLGAGLDGIEASYPYSKTSYDGLLTDSEIEKQVRGDYANRVEILSGGSDYHNDAKKGVSNPRELGECGMTLETFRNQPKLNELWKN